MKMSDVFGLPVEPCKSFDDFYVCGCEELNLIDDQAKAAAHAINLHDKLVDGLDCVLTCWLEDCDPTELALVVNKAMSLLTRAKRGCE